MHTPTTPRFLPLVLLMVAIGASESMASKWSLPRSMPPGVRVQQVLDVDETQRRAIGKKLGGDIQALTNAVLIVHGARVQVNVLSAQDERSAESIHAALSAMHAEPFCVRRGLVVVEFTGRGVDEALVTKTSYEIGLQEKPSHVEYEVSTKLATLDAMDYMSAQALTDAFRSMHDGSDPEALDRIDELSQNMTPGTALVLRDPALSRPTALHELTPSPSEALDRGAFVEYRFDAPPNLHGVPYVDCALRLTVEDTGLTPGEQESLEACTRPTPRWPSDSPKMAALARQIAGDAQGAGNQILALLRWLSPGENLDYSGPMGSRWGVENVLEQRFGRCWDFSDCFVTLARALGIPTRQVAGWLYGSGGHVWAEYYTEGEGWRQVDATGGGDLPCGIYHIPFFTSDDGEMPIVYVNTPTIRVTRAE